MPDSLQYLSDSAANPSRAPFPVTPHDTAELPTVPKAIYVGSGGTIVLRGIDSASDVTLTGIANGAIIPVRPSHIRATGTTAAQIVGLA